VGDASRFATLPGLVLWLAVCSVVGALGAAASVQAASFYAALMRPGWAPPAAVFGPVWTLLYAMMAIAAWRVWNERKAQPVRLALFFFIFQLILNALWSWLFFAWHQGAAAFLDVLLLWLSITATLVLFWRISRLAGLLLLPYLAWVTFASALNYSVWQLNPSLLG
jgi:benzodiazapine receptor